LIKKPFETYHWLVRTTNFALSPLLKYVFNTWGRTHGKCFELSHSLNHLIEPDLSFSANNHHTRLPRRSTYHLQITGR
ncbi:hypothetical protein, partial [Acinetobacter baumannii]|uniref:hypothetical protein n=1 Tax=Acinetobacter baumannii TaxID=470 RepID=UPI001C06EBA2